MLRTYKGDAVIFDEEAISPCMIRREDEGVAKESLHGGVVVEFRGLEHLVAGT